MRYKRLLLKLSGESLQGENAVIDPGKINKIAQAIKEIHDSDIDVAVVIGGGNIWRGKLASQMGMNRNDADYMGMLGTIINSLGLQSALEQIGVQTRVLTAIEIKSVAEPYIRRRAIRHLEKNRVIIFGGGTGQPYFSTDTTAALRAAEINADVILMAKNGVDGIYTANPKTNNKAKKIDTITYKEVISKGLEIMDNTAISLCMDNNIEIVIFEMQYQNIVDAAFGKINGSIINGGK